MDKVRRKNISRAEALELFGHILKSGHTLRVRATGKSMGPIISSGSYVTIKPDVSLPETGAVVLAHPGRGVMMLHRSLKADPAMGVLTIGDTRREPDAIVKPDALLGRAVRVERSGISLNLEATGWRLAGRAIAYCKRLEMFARSTGARAACLLRAML